MSQQGAIIVQSQDPFDPLVDYSEESRRWLERYQHEEIGRLTGWAERAVASLRERRLEEGHALLDQLAKRIVELEGEVEPSILHILQRWHLSALAYYHYCVGEYRSAHRRLIEAHRAIEAAIQERPFLVLLANHCYDFQLQRARVARNAHRWREMRGYIERGRAMLDNRSPLCNLDDGRPVYISELDALYRTVAEHRGVEISDVQPLADPQRRRSSYERFVREMHALPDLIIPYP